MRLSVVGSKFVVLIGVCSLALVLQAHKAYAHFPETQGPLTAILHVEPDDYPAAGSPETIYFIFNDLSDKFNLADCSCNLSISEKGQPLYYAPLVVPPPNQLSIYSTRGNPFTFPKEDTYQIKLVGTPLKANDFPELNLTWNFHVGPSLNLPKGEAFATALKYFAAIIGLLILIGMIVFFIS